MSKYDLLTDTVEVFNNEFDIICESIDRNAQLLNSQCMRLFFQSGFGLEGIKFRLTRTASELRKCSDQVKMEKQALNRINVITQNADGYAHSILSGEAFTPKEMPGADYDKTSWTESIFNFVSDGFNKFKDFAGDGIDLVLKYFDKGVKVTSLVASLFDKLHVGQNIIDMLTWPGAANPFISLYKAFSDGIVTGREALEVTKASTSAFKPFAKLIGSHFGVNWKDIQIFGTTAETAASWLSVAGVGLTTVIAGIDAYNKYNADGEMSQQDWAEFAFDTSFKGLVACGGALLTLACPPAGIGVLAFTLADSLFGITDSAIDGWKSLIKYGAASAAT